MKKVFNVIIGILLIGLIALSVILFMKNKEMQKQCDEFSAEADSWETMYNSMLQSFTEESAAKAKAETKYSELETKYNTLLADYEELEALYNAETAVEYETPTDLSEYSTDITYDNLARTPDDYIGKAVCFKGDVVQLLEGEGENDLRVAINGDYDQMVYFVYDPNVIDTRVLEDDNITMYGIYYGIYSYESTMGTTISIPLILGNYVEIN